MQTHPTAAGNLSRLSPTRVRDDASGSDSRAALLAVSLVHLDPSTPLCAGDLSRLSPARMRDDASGSDSEGGERERFEPLTPWCMLGNAKFAKVGAAQGLLFN